MINTRFLLIAAFFVCGLSEVASAGTADNVCAQSELKALGYYSGEITGRIDAASRSAGEAYLAEKIAEDPGFGQASLSSAEAAMWCKQLAASSPDLLSKYLIAAQGSAGIVRVWGISVDGPTTTQKPYSVQFNFKAEGEVDIKAACFMWNGRDDICFALPAGTKNGPIKVGLTTGRKGSYHLNGYVKYASNGKSFKSAEASTPITVK